MSKIYASFSDPSLAEKAAGALMDYGVQSEDISVIRNGSEEDHTRWETNREATTYGQFGGSGSDPSYASGSTPVSGEFIDRSDPNYIYEGNATENDLSDRHLRAAERTSSSDYVENRLEEDDRDRKREENAAKSGISTTTAGDAGAGAAKGAGIGLGVGVLAALAAVFLPGFGLVLGGGALAAAIGGAAATTGAGAIAGAVTGYLKDQGVDDHIATEYQGTLNSGGALLEVILPSGDVTEDQAREVLNKYGAANVGAYAGSTGGYVS